MDLRRKIQVDVGVHQRDGPIDPFSRARRVAIEQQHFSRHGVELRQGDLTHDGGTRLNTREKLRQAFVNRVGMRNSPSMDASIPRQRLDRIGFARSNNAGVSGRHAGRPVSTLAVQPPVKHQGERQRIGMTQFASDTDGGLGIGLRSREISRDPAVAARFGE